MFWIWIKRKHNKENILNFRKQRWTALKIKIKEFKDYHYEIEIKLIIARLKSKRKNNIIVSAFKKQKNAIYLLNTSYK